MKKTIVKTVIVIAVVMAVVLLLNWNNILLFQMMQKLENCVRQDVQVLDTASVYGKLEGNGNGIQFYGAILVEAETEEKVAALVAELSDRYEEVGYAKQTDNAIQNKHLEHRTLAFSYPSFSENKNYFMIWFFNSQHDFAWALDLLGH